MKNPQKKGSKFERDVCKKLSLWWSYNERDDIFSRSSASGARWTQRKKQGKDTAYSAGDITIIDPIGKEFLDFFLVECKSGYSKDIDVLDFIDKKRGRSLLFKWIEKAEKEKEEAGRKFFLIIFSRNFKETCVIFYSSLISYFNDVVGEYQKEFIEIDLVNKRFFLVKFDDFLDWLSPEDVKGYF